MNASSNPFRDQINPYETPNERSRDKPPASLGFKATASHATRCLVFFLITIVGTVMASLMIVPETRMFGFGGLVVAVIGLCCWSAAVRDWRTAVKSKTAD